LIKNKIKNSNKQVESKRDSLSAQFCFSLLTLVKSPAN